MSCGKCGGGSCRSCSSKKSGSMPCGTCGSGSCSCLSATSNIRLITAEQLHEKNEHSSGHMVINVLGEDAYAACHIQGSINVPFDRLATTAASWQKNKEIIVYCSSAQCSASKKAYALLVGLGFINVYEYAGGMKEWREKGLPVGGTCVAG